MQKKKLHIFLFKTSKDKHSNIFKTSRRREKAKLIRHGDNMIIMQNTNDATSLFINLNAHDIIGQHMTSKYKMKLFY